MFLSFLFSLQGSLYELDKVSFIQICCESTQAKRNCTQTNSLFSVTLRIIIVSFIAASESHREVHAPLGISPEQGVYERLIELNRAERLIINFTVESNKSD